MLIFILCLLSIVTLVVFLGAFAYILTAFTEETRNYAVANDQVERLKAWKVDTVSVHTYNPHGSEIPERGRIVLEAGLSCASKYNAPLILAVGQTVPGERRTEAQIYFEAIKRPNPVKIILGTDSTARETFGEIMETLRICRNMGSTHHLVVGLEPHIARIKLLWDRAHPTKINPTVVFNPVQGPLRYWIWETLMLIVYFVAPPKSKLQGLLLDMVGRKG